MLYGRDLVHTGGRYVRRMLSRSQEFNQASTQVQNHRSPSRASLATRKAILSRFLYVEIICGSKVPVISRGNSSVCVGKV